MFDSALRVAFGSEINRNKIAKLILIAATNSDKKINNKNRTKILKTIEEAVKDQIEIWKKSSGIITKMDVKNAPKRITESLIEKFIDEEIELLEDVPFDEKEADKVRIDILSDIIADTFEGYQQGAAFKVGSENELIFASENEALQHLANITGSKIEITE